MLATGIFGALADDLVLNILSKLDGDPRDWARLSCVSSRFAALVRDVCCRAKCSAAIPAVVADLLSTSGSGGGGDDPPGGWAALLKLSVCCPGLFHAGVLLDSSDFGLEREAGPDDNTLHLRPSASCPPPPEAPPPPWSLLDDLYLDAAYDASEGTDPEPEPEPETDRESDLASFPPTKRRRSRREGSAPAAAQHPAAGRAWSLSREQGGKLLGSSFRGDSLYICDWPGCVHAEERRKYMLFRGVFKDFRRSRVWRTINDGGGDGGRRRAELLECAFCGCREMWDLHSAFCLRSFFGYHDDGEPVVRAFVCRNGHVAGAWTERPMYP